jgi:DNA-binding NtrC family response regulator
MSTEMSHIALVDDDVEFAERLIEYYRPRKIDFVHFESPNKLLAELRSRVGEAVPYDLIMTDLMMPELDGIEFTKQVKAVHPELPVIVMTSNSSVDKAIEAINSGATDYIVKPPHFPNLTMVLQRTQHFSQLQKENAILRRTIEGTADAPDGIVAKSPALHKAIELAKRVAPSEATVLITGESGTGKEVFARLIHRSSRRADRPFIAINCSAIPENLLESELFGHAKGSFTGAEQSRAGLFEEAEGGTLFLDEIGDMPFHLQSKLLRVLQERKIKRIGENQMRDVNVRIIAATLKNLGEEVKMKRFREDLFYRLNVIPIRLPSLRERKEDILPLARHFLERFSARYSKPIRGFTREAAEWLLSSSWRGNVRELENAIERAAVVSSASAIGIDDLRFDALAVGPGLEDGSGVPSEAGSGPAGPSESASDSFANGTGAYAGNEAPVGVDADRRLIEEFEMSGGTAEARPLGAESKSAAGGERMGSSIISLVEGDAGDPITLADLEMRYIREVLERCEGVKDRAAKVLGIDRKTLYRKLQADAEKHVDVRSSSEMLAER